MSTVSVAAGKMRHKVAVQTATQARAADGGATYTWATARYVFAEIRPVSAREQLSGDRINQEVTHIIRTRKIPGFTYTPSMRILWGSRVFNIEKAMDAQERAILVEMTAIEDLNA